MSNIAILPDSPSWIKTNSGNSAVLTETSLFYSALFKIYELDIQSGHCLSVKTLDINDRHPNVLALDARYNLLAGIFSDNLLAIWDLSSSSPFHTFKLPPDPTTITISSPDTLFIGLKDGSVLSYSFPSQVLFHVSKLKSPIIYLKSYFYFLLGVDSSGNVISYSIQDKAVNEYNLACNAIGVDTVISEADIFMCVVTSKGTFNIYKNYTLILESSSLSTRQKAIPKATCCKFINESQCILGHGGGELSLLTIGESNKHQMFLNNSHYKAILYIKAESDVILSISTDRKIIRWNISKPSMADKMPRAIQVAEYYDEPVWEIFTTGGSIYHLEVLRSDMLLLCDGSKNIYKVKLTSNPLNIISTQAIYKPFKSKIISCALSSNANSVLACRDSESNILFIDIETERKISNTKLDNIIKLEWYNDTSTLIYTKNAVYQLNYKDSSYSALFSVPYEITTGLYDNGSILIGTIEGNILAYDTTGHCAWYSTTHIKKVNCLSVQGRLVASGSDDCKIVISDMDSRLVYTIFTQHTRPVTVLKWSPHDKSLLASGSIDHTIQIWNIESKSPVMNLRGHYGVIRHLIWHSEYKDLIISGSDDQSVRIWSLASIQEHTTPPKLTRIPQPPSKTLFPQIHSFIFQENKESAFLALQRLAEEVDVNSLEYLFYKINKGHARQIIVNLIESGAAEELKFWLASTEGPLYNENSAEEMISEEYEDLAPMLGYKTWQNVCRKRAVKCMLERKNNKAVLYFLSYGDINKALEVYINYNMLIEVIILGSLHSIDISQYIYSLIQKLISNGKLEQAAKFYIGLEDFSSAAGLLKDYSENECVRNIIVTLDNKTLSR